MTTRLGSRGRLGLLEATEPPWSPGDRLWHRARAVLGWLRHSSLGGLRWTPVAAGHLWLCHLLLGRLLWLQLGFRFCFPAFPGRVNTPGRAGTVPVRGMMLISKGAGTAVQGFLSVHKPEGLPERPGGMEASRSDSLGGRQELRAEDGSWQAQDLEGLRALSTNGCSGKLLGGRWHLSAGEVLRGREVVESRESLAG